MDSLVFAGWFEQWKVFPLKTQSNSMVWCRMKMSPIERWKIHCYRRRQCVHWVMCKMCVHMHPFFQYYSFLSRFILSQNREYIYNLCSTKSYEQFCMTSWPKECKKKASLNWFQYTYIHILVFYFDSFPHI